MYDYNFLESITAVNGITAEILQGDFRENVFDILVLNKTHIPFKEGVLDRYKEEHLEYTKSYLNSNYSNVWATTQFMGLILLLTVRIEDKDMWLEIVKEIINK